MEIMWRHSQRLHRNKYTEAFSEIILAKDKCRICSFLSCQSYNITCFSQREKCSHCCFTEGVFREVHKTLVNITFLELTLIVYRTWLLLTPNGIFWKKRSLVLKFPSLYLSFINRLQRIYLQKAKCWNQGSKHLETTEATWNQKWVFQGRKDERKLRRRKGKGKHGCNRGSYKVTEYEDDGRGHSRRKMTRKCKHC